MKQDLNSEQTAKLIELGFEKPKNERWVLDVANESTPSIQNIVKRQDYSIGELIEMLPRTIKSYYDLSVLSTSQGWWVLYGMIGDGDMWSIEHEIYRNELIDALYDMIIMLKEEGVI